MVTRTRKSTKQRREEIARAVLRIIGERGLASLTIANVAEEVGLTTGALFRHFASREEMLREAARHAITEMEATFPPESAPPLDRILELARRRLAVLGSDAGISWIVRSDQAWLTLSPDALEPLKELVLRTRKFLLKAIREGAAVGVIRDDIAPEVLFVPVIGTIHALLDSPGVHRFAVGRGRRTHAPVLDALARLISPPRENPCPSNVK